jgi:TetR/AcrR family acrAB operon transcriptional repressor/TetR/AcrR family transcriptional repressor of mexAB-oprM operon
MAGVTRRTMGGASGRILESAAERFAENGYHGTTIEEIAEAAETSRSSLFWHFQSKEGLLRAVIADTLSWVQMISEAAQEHRGLDGLRSAVVVLHKFQVEQPSRLRLLSILMSEASASEPNLVPIFIEIEQAMLEIWRRGLSQAAEDGELRPGVDPEQAALALHTMAYGMKQLWALTPQSYQVAAMEATSMHLLDTFSVSGPKRSGTSHRGTSATAKPKRS